MLSLMLPIVLLVLTPSALPVLADPGHQEVTKQSASPVFTPQLPFSECVSDPDRLLALGFEDFDQGVQPEEEGLRAEWGWRPIARQDGCFFATAELLQHWRSRHGEGLNALHQTSLILHEAQMRAGGGDYAAAIDLVELLRGMESNPSAEAYYDAILAFLRHDREALLAARQRLLAVPEPPNWADVQRMFREQAGQEMNWPLNIEVTDELVRCFGRPYPVYGEC